MSDPKPTEEKKEEEEVISINLKELNKIEDENKGLNEENTQNEQHVFIRRVVIVPPAGMPPPIIPLLLPGLMNAMMEADENHVEPVKPVEPVQPVKPVKQTEHPAKPVKQTEHPAKPVKPVVEQPEPPKPEPTTNLKGGTVKIVHPVHHQPEPPKPDTAELEKELAIAAYRYYSALVVLIFLLSIASIMMYKVVQSRNSYFELKNRVNSN